jgi:vancomycin resistance protein VanW
MARKLFCEICPFTYALSLQKERLKRHIRNLMGNERYAIQHDTVQLPVVVSSQHNNMIKRGPGINPLHQQNKADNIRLACSKIDGLLIHPGEVFSFWKTVGKTSRTNGYKDGRILVNGRLTAGVGGGLCNLANTINLLILHSPMTITELHHHSDALAPDPNGLRHPYSAGTSVNYNFVDYRFRNDTDQTVQLCIWCEGDELMAELRSEHPYPYTYRLTEEGHHFHQETDGAYYRISKIYRETLDRKTGEVICRKLNWDNHSRVMFDPSLLPPEQIR